MPSPRLRNFNQTKAARIAANSAATTVACLDNGKVVSSPVSVKSVDLLNDLIASGHLQASSIALAKLFPMSLRH